MDTAAGVMSASDARVDAVLQGDVGTLDAIVDDFYGGDAGKVRDAGDDANEGKEGRVASMIERARGRARREDDARVKGTMDGFPARRGRDAACGEETRRRRGIERRVIVGRAWERSVVFRARERARW